MRGLRTLAVAAVTASTVALGGTPAHAATAVRFEGDAYIACFGCGATSGTADIWVTGVLDNTVVGPAVYGLTPPNARASFSAHQPSETCPLTGTATGTVTVLTSNGQRSMSFNWTRVGSEAVVTTTNPAAVGRATFFVTSPVGNPCGQRNVVAHFSGSLGGA